jgi:hypothetical protein
MCLGIIQLCTSELFNYTYLNFNMQTIARPIELKHGINLVGEQLCTLKIVGGSNIVTLKAKTKITANIPGEV